MILIYILLLILILINIIPYIIKYNKKYNTSFTFYGSTNKYILTKNELSFFYKLKTITDKYDLYIFPKVRLADIINTYNYSDFNKIKSKHIDFTICNKYCSPILFIELDDNSHYRIKRMENDAKKDYIMSNAKANLIRIKVEEVNYKLKEIETILVEKIK